MAATYTEGGVSPIDRIRRCVPDTVIGGDELFQDERYYAWLEHRLAPQMFRLWMPDNNVLHNTTAAATVAMVGANLTLTLVCDVSGTQAIVLAPAMTPLRIGELVERILRLEWGWYCGLDNGDGKRNWFEDGDVENGADFREDVDAPVLESLADYAHASLLAITGTGGAGAAINCFAEYRLESAGILHFYDFAAVRLMALQDLTARKTSRAIESRKEGNVSRKWADAMAAAEMDASHGIYSGAC